MENGVVQNVGVLEGVVSAVEHHGSLDTTKITLDAVTLAYLPYRIDLPCGVRVCLSGEWKTSPKAGKYFRADKVSVVDTQPETRPMGNKRDKRPQKERPLVARILGRRPVDEAMAQRVSALAPVIEYLLASGHRAKAKRIVLKSKDPHAIRRNPFKLYLSGVLDWQTTNELADRLLLAPDAQERIDSALREAVEQAYASGRSSISAEDARKAVADLIDIEISDERAREAKTIVTDADGRCWLPKIFNLRRLTLAKLAKNTIVGSPAGGDDDALLELTGQRYVILTGPAGSGKTTALRETRALYERHGFRVAMTATTGKAASVLSDDASTVHRVLGFGHGGFSVKELAADVLIVDEAGMLDWPTAWAIFRAAQGRVVLSGDPSQLPPVAGGSVFRELLDVLPVVALEKLHRFAGGAPNVTWVRRRNIWDALSTAITLAVQSHRKGEECQVLAPIKGLPIGAVNLNLVLQRLLNPAGERHGKFRFGDRVIVTKNLPDRGAWNGQIGKIRGIDGGGRFLVDLPNGRTVDVWDADIDLAYCLTVHKAQGSQFTKVILVLPEQEHLAGFLTDELLRTATTRAVEGTTVVAVQAEDGGACGAQAHLTISGAEAEHARSARNGA